MEEQKVYLQLSEAMECVHHIFTEGCTLVSPCVATKGTISNNKKKGVSCPNYTTCHVLQNLIKHLASCRVNRAACPPCRRIRDFLRLYSSTCQLTDHCKVLLCKGNSSSGCRWRVKVMMEDGSYFAKKVVSAKVISSLAKRRKHDLENKL